MARTAHVRVIRARSSGEEDQLYSAEQYCHLVLQNNINMSLERHLLIQQKYVLLADIHTRISLFPQTYIYMGSSFVSFLSCHASYMLTSLMLEGLENILSASCKVVDIRRRIQLQKQCQSRHWHTTDFLPVGFCFFVINGLHWAHSFPTY